MSTNYYHYDYWDNFKYCLLRILAWLVVPVGFVAMFAAFNALGWQRLVQ